ncbi:MAG: tRNA pseudouridine(38-40) synthase TruA [Erysipelotrichales bacterium]|nr:tRNA pseudouridine(38-40) synthase TruA [Erysipelotrichales bacterium]
MNYKAIISYDGTNFHGFQAQEGLRTVEAELMDKLAIILKTKVKIYASGRTDRGVHALNQVINFHSEIIIPVDKFKIAINKVLPGDIYFKEIKVVLDNFHARHHCTRKEYLYLINNQNYDPLKANYQCHIPRPLDLELMRSATKFLIGTHDFKGFTTNENKTPSIKTIHEITINEENGLITIYFNGSGFLKYMVRSIMGVLIEIGLKRKAVTVINEIFSERKRHKCGRIAIPNGLYLKNAYYEDNYGKS